MMRGQLHLFEMAKERNKASTGESEATNFTLKCSDLYFSPFQINIYTMYTTAHRKKRIKGE